MKSLALLAFALMLLSACSPEQGNNLEGNSSLERTNSTENKNRRMKAALPSGSLQTSSIKNYQEARPLLWSAVYKNGGESLYCGKPFKDPKKRRGFNVEHVFPMSWATNGVKCGKRKQCRARSARFNLIEADLHNLFPSRSDVNQDRSSFRFGEVPGEARSYGRSCDFEVDTRQRVAEPRQSVRGDIARAMLYMADRYKSDGLILFKKQALLLERWHKLDPPSNEELRRNNIIESLQGNRNQFIDEPSKVHLLIRSGHFFN